VILFVSGSPDNHLSRMAERHAEVAAGMMSCPFARNDVRRAVALGMPWCLDNGCFNRYDPAAIVRMLLAYRDVPGCVFATVPDVVSDHAATLALFGAWQPVYAELGYPPAFVLQDGITGPADVPWDRCAAVFIGGSTRFKYSDTVRVIVAEAKRRGKWVHMGRVNTDTRLEYAGAIDTSSVDGTRFPCFNDGYQFAQRLIIRQLPLFAEAS
jgi:hypothetical protein